MCVWVVHVVSFLDQHRAPFCTGGCHTQQTFNKTLAIQNPDTHKAERVMRKTSFSTNEVTQNGIRKPFQTNDQDLLASNCQNRTFSYSKQWPICFIDPVIIIKLKTIPKGGDG